MTTRVGSDERGMVTAEMAVVLPTLAVVLVFALWSVAAVTQQLRCVDAARIAARELARGDSVDASVDAARAAAPTGARVLVSRSGDLVVVDVQAGVRLPGPWSGALPDVTLSGRAVALVESDPRLAGVVP
jgi:Flp pilus assembly protein TadG